MPCLAPQPSHGGAGQRAGPGAGPDASTGAASPAAGLGHGTINPLYFSCTYYPVFRFAARLRRMLEVAIL